MGRLANNTTTVNATVVVLLLMQRTGYIAPIKNKVVTHHLGSSSYISTRQDRRVIPMKNASVTRWH